MPAAPPDGLPLTFCSDVEVVEVVKVAGFPAEATSACWRVCSVLPAGGVSRLTVTRSDSDPGRGVMTAPNGPPPGGLSAVRVSPRADRVCRGAEFRGCRDLRDGLAPTAATAPVQSLTWGQRTGRSATQDGPAPARTRAPAHDLTFPRTSRGAPGASSADDSAPGSGSDRGCPWAGAREAGDRKTTRASAPRATVSW